MHKDRKIADVSLFKNAKLTLAINYMAIFAQK